MQGFLDNVFEYLSNIAVLEIAGLFFGLLAVYFLIKENIWTWPMGIIYILISFIIFGQARLYGDFILHIFFLILNIYGWHYWIYGNTREGKEELPVTKMDLRQNLRVFGLSCIGVFIFGYFLSNVHYIFKGMDGASLPYWDATTSCLSVTGMWLTAKKKLENWYYWLAVDILATGIYFYKGIYFYSILYLVYIGLAVAGYLAWKKSMELQSAK